jgi:hypothetical protein
MERTSERKSGSHAFLGRQAASLPDLEHAGSMFAETDWQSIFRQADRLSVVVD